MKKTIIILLTVFVCPYLNAAPAQSAALSTLDINTGARAAALAGAFTGIADDASAIYYNPAGLSNIKMVEIDIAYDKWLMDSSFQYGNLVIPAGPGSAGAMFTYTNFGTFVQRDAGGANLFNDLNPYNLSATIAYGMPVREALSAGLGINFSNYSMAGYNDYMLSFDLGLLLKINDMFSAGAALQNLDTSLSGGYNLRAGVGINLFNIKDYKMLADLDLIYSGIYGTSGAVGAELTIFKILSVRCGYAINNSFQALGALSGLSAGLGITLEKLSFDYAFASKGDLGITNLVSIKLLYEAQDEVEKKNYQKLTEFLAYQNYRNGEEAFNAGNYNQALADWSDVKSMAPNYKDIDLMLVRVKKLISTGGGVKKADDLYNEGMQCYEAFDFECALNKWNEVKNIAPAYKDIDTWIGDAKELKANKGMTKLGEKYFKEGLKYYNNCDYVKALASWEQGLEKDPKNTKIKQYIARTKYKQSEIWDDINKAKAEVANDASVIEGVKRLRTISGICPANKEATDILATLKELIALKTKDYYYKGIEKYTDGNLDAAVIYWKNIDELDPDCDYAVKVRRYIMDARSKQKALQGFKKTAN
jgi:hypothetical protein